MRWKSKDEAKKEINELVAEYYHLFLDKSNKEFKVGDRINYAARVYDERELQSLTSAALDFWLTAGPYTEQFERDFSNWLGVKYSHLVNSGSSANLLAFMVLTASELGERRINRGDEVITVACGFPTTVAPIIQYGAIPVFVDMDIPQYNINTRMLERAYTPKTKAVMIAHTLGNPFNIKEVKRFCEAHNLWLIEDNCDSLGSKYTIDDNTKYTGTWGDIGTSSFYPPHHITMGEGGCIYTNNSLLNRLILSYRDWGRDCICPPGKDNFCGKRYENQWSKLPEGYDHKYVYSHLGYNLKATDLQAAIGIEQLKKLPMFIEKRKNNWKKLYDKLESYTEYIILPQVVRGGEPSWFGFLISLIEGKANRNKVVQYLENHNIQTRLLFSGNLIKHPCFDSIRDTDAYRVIGTLRNTDYIMNNSFWVGVYPELNDVMMDYIGDTIIDAVMSSQGNEE